MARRAALAASIAIFIALMAVPLFRIYQPMNSVQGGSTAKFIEMRVAENIVISNVKSGPKNNTPNFEVFKLSTFKFPAHFKGHGDFSVWGDKLYRRFADSFLKRRSEKKVRVFCERGVHCSPRAPVDFNVFRGRLALVDNYKIALRHLVCIKSGNINVDKFAAFAGEICSQLPFGGFLSASYKPPSSAPEGNRGECENDCECGNNCIPIGVHKLAQAVSVNEKIVSKGDIVIKLLLGAILLAAIHALLKRI